MKSLFICEVLKKINQKDQDEEENTHFTSLSARYLLQ